MGLLTSALVILCLTALPLVEWFALLGGLFAALGLLLTTAIEGR